MITHGVYDIGRPRLLLMISLTETVSDVCCLGVFPKQDPAGASYAAWCVRVSRDNF